MRSLVSAWAALALVVAGCASDDGAPASDGDAIHARGGGDDNAFEPRDASVAAGTMVTWDVVGAAHHTVTFESDPGGGPGRLDSDDLAPGETYELTFTEPGTYDYHCRYHSNGESGMVGTITVT